MPNDEVKLAGCPFCGGRAEVHGRGRCWVECSQCHVETPGDETTKADAITAWNRRAIPSTVSGETKRYTPAQIAVFDTLAKEGGGTWATYMMLQIEAAFANPAETQAVEVGE